MPQRGGKGGEGGGEAGSVSTLLELGALEVLLHLETGEVCGLASVLLKVLPVLCLLALPQLEGKLQLQRGGQGAQHCGVQLINALRQNHSLQLSHKGQANSKFQMEVGDRVPSTGGSS